MPTNTATTLPTSHCPSAANLPTSNSTKTPVRTPRSYHQVLLQRLGHRCPVVPLLERHVQHPHQLRAHIDARTRVSISTPVIASLSDSRSVNSVWPAYLKAAKASDASTSPRSPWEHTCNHAAQEQPGCSGRHLPLAPSLSPMQQRAHCSGSPSRCQHKASQVWAMRGQPRAKRRTGARGRGLAGAEVGTGRSLVADLSDLLRCQARRLQVPRQRRAGRRVVSRGPLPAQTTQSQNAARPRAVRDRTYRILPYRTL